MSCEVDGLGRCCVVSRMFSCLVGGCNYVENVFVKLGEDAAHIGLARLW